MKKKEVMEFKFSEFHNGNFIYCSKQILVAISKFLLNEIITFSKYFAELYKQRHWRLRSIET